MVGIILGLVQVGEVVVTVKGGLLDDMFDCINNNIPSILTRSERKEGVLHKIHRDLYWY